MVSVTPRRVALSELHPNAWNPNQMNEATFRKEISSLERWGQILPIITRTVGGMLEIVDGEHRWLAMRELKWAEADIWDLGEVSEHEAQQLTLVLNRLRGEDDPVKLKTMLRGLVAFEPLPELLSVLPWSKAEFEKLADLPQVDWNDLDRKPSPKAGTKWVERIYRMPPDVAEVLDNALAKAKRAAKDEDIDDHLTDVGALELIAADYLASP